ncbi:glycosyltransferase family 2 protein [Escherichia coli]|uniref:glycosyltransferase family 2 protein n=1 Tax=Escherichia coli TaxID=562 RepID=UPI00351D638C
MISIGAIFKNEYPFIIEWVAYHIILGIDEIYIADNISTDGSSELLYVLDQIGLIKRIEYPTKKDTPPQMGAYREILSSIDKNKWIAFIDADEFISPTNYEDGLNKLSPLLNDPVIGAISLNWAVYGSSYSLIPDDRLVIERFNKRAVDVHPVNGHYKSIVRVSDVISTGPTPHAFTIKSDKKFVMPNQTLHENINGICKLIDYSIIRLNHYVIKSKAEFINKKSSRPRADQSNSGYAMRFFNNHDLNDIEQSMPSWFLDKVKNQIKIINERLSNYGYQVINRNTLEPFYRTSKKYGLGVIDTCTKHLNKFIFRGWAVDGEKKACFGIVAVINNSILLHPSSISFHNRIDVQNAGYSDVLECGFSASIELPKLSISNINIYAVNSAGLACVEFKMKTQLSTALVTENNAQQKD